MMNYTFVPMTQEYASVIVEQWKYDGDFSIYDYENEAEHIFDEQAWGMGLFAVLDQKQELIAELSIEFYNDQEEPLEYSDFADPSLVNSCEMWIGFGLRPDLVGQGHGAEFVQACVDFAVRQTHYQRKTVGLGVALFNQRAIKAYEKAGFSIFQQTSGEIAGRQLECVQMRKILP